MDRALNHVDHPDDHRYDHIDIQPVERWKESELSGDEWRFSYMVNAYRKGNLLSSKVAGSFDAALALIPQMGHAGNLAEGEFFPEAYEMTRPLCDQPGCESYAVKFYLRMTRYTKQGEKLADGHGTEYRQFCERHSTRGDCALDDADHNYQELYTMRIVEWGGNDPYLARLESQCSCGFEFSGTKENIRLKSWKHLQTHGGGVLVEGIIISAFIVDDEPEPDPIPEVTLEPGYMERGG